MTLKTMAQTFQHTAARRRLLHLKIKMILYISVSTHSRPKAAAIYFYLSVIITVCFNTQPPEGGCLRVARPMLEECTVSTHSRPKAAAIFNKFSPKSLLVSTHSRPKAAANLGFLFQQNHLVSTHSRPKAAAPYIKKQEKSVH